MTENSDSFITQLQDVSGRTWKYGYGTGIEWNLIKTYTDPNGKVATNYWWDGSNNELLQITSPCGAGDEVRLTTATAGSNQ